MANISNHHRSHHTVDGGWCFQVAKCEMFSIFSVSISNNLEVQLSLIFSVFFSFTRSKLFEKVRLPGLWCTLSRSYWWYMNITVVQFQLEPGISHLTMFMADYSALQCWHGLWQIEKSQFIASGHLNICTSKGINLALINMLLCRVFLNRVIKGNEQVSVRNLTYMTQSSLITIGLYVARSSQ